MLVDFQLAATSNWIRVKIRSSTAPYGGATGLTSATSGLKIGTIANNEATSTAYTVAGGTIETISTLGTFAAPTATKCRFKEVDATNHPGIYEIQLDNARFAVTNAKSLVISVTGTGLAECDVTIPLLGYNPYNGTNLALTCLPSAAPSTTGGFVQYGTGLTQLAPVSGKVSVASGGITSSSFGSNALGAVWDELRSAHTTTGTYGAYVLANTAADASIAPASTALSTATWTATRAGYLDNLSAGAVATASSLTTVGTNVSSILTQTGTTGVVVASGSKAGYTLTQTFPTNFSSLAITAGGAVTVGTNSDKTGYSLSTTPPTAAQIATQVWSETVPGSYTSGQAGNVLGNVATGTPPTAAAIADAVWDEARSGHTTAGTFGQYVLARDDAGAALAVASTALSTATWTGTRAGYLDNLSAGAVATASALSTASGNIATILGQTGTTGVVVASASKTGYTLSSAGLDSIPVETGVNARQALSPILASAAGVLSGAGTGTIVIKAGANSGTTRVTATTDSSGNRSSVTLSLPS